MTIWVPLGELCQVSQGVTLSRFRILGGYHFKIIQIANLNLLDPDDEFETESLMFSTPQVEEGEVLLSLRGSPIRAVVVPKWMEGYVASPNIALLKPEKDSKSVRSINPHYLAGLLGSRYMTQFFNIHSSRGSITSLNVRKLRELKIPVPPPELQQYFAEAFSAQSRFTMNAQKIITLQAERLEVELEHHLPTNNV